MSNLFTRNSACISRSLRNTKTELKLPKKTLQMGRNVSRIEVQNCGTASQLRKNRHPPLLCSNRILNGLGDFSCNRVTGRGPRSPCLIAAEPAMEICFGISVVGLAGSGEGAGAAPVAWSLEKFPSLSAFNVHFFYFCILGFTF